MVQAAMTPASEGLDQGQLRRPRSSPGGSSTLQWPHGGANVECMVDYSRRGVLDAQMRVHERLHRILAESDTVLDPGSPIWFDGRLDLPKPGEHWTMKLSCRGATALIEFSPVELDAFLEVRPPEVISAKLRRAADALRPPSPQEHGLA